jgi:hypothetical protein
VHTPTAAPPLSSLAKTKETLRMTKNLFARRNQGLKGNNLINCTMVANLMPYNLQKTTARYFLDVKFA